MIVIDYSPLNKTRIHELIHKLINGGEGKAFPCNRISTKLRRMMELEVNEKYHHTLHLKGF